MGRFEENDVRVLLVEGDVTHTHFRHGLAFANKTTLNRNQVVAFEKPRQVSRWLDFINRIEIGVGNASHPFVTQIENKILPRFDGAWKSDATLGGNDARIANAAFAFDSKD